VLKLNISIRDRAIYKWRNMDCWKIRLGVECSEVAFTEEHILFEKKLVLEQDLYREKRLRLFGAFQRYEIKIGRSTIGLGRLRKSETVHLRGENLF
jgi:hypothetical protein